MGSCAPAVLGCPDAERTGWVWSEPVSPTQVENGPPSPTGGNRQSWTVPTPTPQNHPQGVTHLGQGGPEQPPAQLGHPVGQQHRQVEASDQCGCQGHGRVKVSTAVTHRSRRKS